MAKREKRVFEVDSGKVAAMALLGDDYDLIAHAKEADELANEINKERAKNAKSKEESL